MNSANEIAVDVGLTRDLLENIIEVVCSQVRVRKIILYGSRGASRHSRHSDIDIAIELDRDSPVLLKCEIEERLQTLLRVDIVDMAKVPKNLGDEIRSTGVCLYEAT